MKNIILTLTISIFLVSMPVNAVEFWKTGKITRTLSDINYGGCMVFLDVGIANGCPPDGWISLDCKDVFLAVGTGDRNYASAIVAASLGKQVSILIDNQNKNDAYCVGRRIDVMY